MSPTEPARGGIEATEQLADFSDWDALRRGIAGLVERARAITVTGEIEGSFAAIEHAPDADGERAARWRGLVGAAFVADLACYAEPADQVSFDRLEGAMRVCPQGFRVWGARAGGAGSAWLPLGYTAVIPIAATTFAWFEEGTASLTGPVITALPEIEPGGSFLYLFNFSVVPSLRGTTMAARVVKALADDVARTPHRGLAALTVSGDGERVVKRFGLSARGSAGHETVFACRTR
ncbi:MAG: hypothetical protein ABJE95_18790 [Byssovorax sp.]